jgi:esterase/lipase
MKENINIILTAVGGFITAVISAFGAYKMAIANTKKAHAEEKDSMTKGTDQLIETTMKILDRQDKIIEQQSKSIEHQSKSIENVKEFYKSENSGLKANKLIMHNEIKELQHSYNSVLHKSVEENTLFLKKNIELLEKISKQ